MKRRVAELPLHGGRAPRWLFGRMVKLAGAVCMAVVDEHGAHELLRRLADPWWFQAFGCVLGFDWHSSGLTTVTCGALGQAYRRCGDDLGIVVAGGKGGTSRRTPQQIADAADRYAITEGDRLIYASRLSAKVDSAAVQDGYQIYHHSFFLTKDGAWCVVQQGMNAQRGWARRYHWLGESVRDFVCEPHEGICDLSQPAGDDAQPSLLNMVAAEAESNRQASAALVRDDPEKLAAEVARLTEGPTLFAPERHRIVASDINGPRLQRIVRSAYEQQPADFEALLGAAQVGPATIRGLSLLAELIYKAPASHRYPACPRADADGQAEATDRSARRWADYAYAHGGKDGIPFPVDRGTYDRNIAILTEAVRRARVGDSDRTAALRRLGRYSGT